MFSIPYNNVPKTSYWGPTNSQSNFCEEDHIITAYIAEFVNTLTNVTYLYYAYHGIKQNANRKDAILRNLPYLGIAGVGFGSGIYHATLKNYTQWCDELSMLIATAFVLHRVFTFDKSLTLTITSGLIAASLMSVFVTWHCWMDEVVMHDVLFGLMIAIVGIKTRSIISTRVSSPSIRAEVTKLATYGAIIFVSGFAIWNIDNVFCSQLTVAKRAIGMPWSFVLELHGWWHVFTGVGAYVFIALVEYLTSEEAGEPLGKGFAWPVGMLVDCEKGMGDLVRAGAVDGKVDGSEKIL